MTNVTLSGRTGTKSSAQAIYKRWMSMEASFVATSIDCGLTALASEQRARVENMIAADGRDTQAEMARFDQMVKEKSKS